MAVPTIVGTGTDTAATTGTLTLPLPAGYTTGDVLLAFVETNVTTGAALSAGSVSDGWVHITNSPRAQGSNVTSVSVCWKRAASASETNPSFSGSSDHQVGFTMAVRSAADPSDFTPVGSGNASGANMSATGGTTTVADVLILCASGNQTDTASDNYTTLANTTLSNEQFENQAFTTNGNGGGVMVASGSRATAGSTGTFTATITTAGGTANLVFGLAPGSTTTALNLTPATETDAAVALVENKSWTLAPASGTNAAVALGRQKARTATPSTETDVAVAIGRLKSRSITPATETEAAVTLTGGLVGGTDALNLTPATETDTAVTITRVKSRTITPATETDVVVTVGRRKARTPTPVTETDAAQTLTRTKRRTATPSTETSSAPTLGRVSLRTLTAAAETAAAVVLGRRKARTLAPALEVDAAVAMEQQSAHQVADPDRLLIVHHEGRTLEVHSDPRRISALFEDRVRPVFAESRIISIHEE